MSRASAKNEWLQEGGPRSFLKPKMPTPGVYEAEYSVWPWGLLLDATAKWVVANAPPGAFVVDYMCGTGCLLNRIAQKRSDLALLGCDISHEYIAHGRRSYCSVKLIEADALKLRPERQPDIILCTAGIHHLLRRDQSRFVKKVATELASDGSFVIGEELIGAYRNERERRNSALALFTGLMDYMQESNIGADVVQAAADMFVNDWCQRGEFKLSRRELASILSSHFRVVSVAQSWPVGQTRFGDWLLVCHKRTKLSRYV